MAVNRDAPTPEQSRAAQEIAAVMAKLAVDSEKVAESLRGQAKAMAEICEAMKCFESTQSIQNMNQLVLALRGVNDISKTTSTTIILVGRDVRNLSGDFGGLGGQIRDAGGQAGKTNKEFDRSKKTSFLLSIALGALIGAYDGLKASIKATLAVSKATLSFFGSIISSAFSITKAILAIPFKMFSALIDMADKGGNSISELAEAINGMRKEFGTLAGPTNKAIMGTAKAMSSLTIPGTSTFQIFGNVAERLKMLTELYASSGPNLRSFAQEIEKTKGAAVALQKGLGLTAEGMETMASISKNSGKPLTQTLVNVTKHADHMAKRFGLDAKLISKDLVKAAGDFKNFGNVSIKEMGIAVTYATKLGLSLDKITGTMDAFGTFDDAADNVSKLNEAFGTNIDAMEIMQAETPDKKLEILRKEMRKAGIEGEKLNHVQRKMIASATGLDDQAIIAATSTKNYGVSLKEIKKEGEKAEKKTLTQAQAMEKLADAMERMLKPGQSLTDGKGLFGGFLAGVMKGIEMSPEFMQMMSAIKRAIVAFFNAGMVVGRKFVELFPGIKDVFSAITKIFDPAKVTQMTQKITSAFTEFFKDIGDPNSKNSFGKLMEKLQDAFFNYFNSNTPEGRELVGGFKKIFIAIIRMIGEAIPYVMQQVTKVALAITEFIKDPKAYIKKLGAGGSDSGFGPVFAEAFENIKQAWPALRDSLVGLFQIAFEKFKSVAVPWMKSTLLPMGEKVLKYMATGFAIRTGITMLIGALLGALKAALLGAIEALFTGGGGGLAGRFVTGLKNLLGPTLTKVLGKTFIVAAVADAAINISKSMEEFSDTLQKKGFDPATSKIAAGTTGLINTITLGLLPKDLQAKISESVAEMSKILFDTLDKWFGPGFSDSIKKLFSSFFDFFAGIGDALLGIWNGDQSKVNSAFQKIGESLWNFLMGAIEFVGNLAIKLGPLLLSYVTSAIGWLLDKISMVLEGIKSSPILRVILGILTFGFSEVLIVLAPIIKKIGSLFTEIGKFFMDVYETVKQVNITQMFRDMGDAIVDFGKSALNALLWPFKKAFEFYMTIQTWMWNNVYKPIVNIFTTAATTTFQLITWPFVKAWEVIKGVVSYLWDTFTGLLENFKVWGNDILNILTDPHTKAWEKIKEVLAYIWSGFKELPSKLIEWGKGLLDKITSPFKGSWEWIKENFSIKKFAEIGQAMVDGIKEKLSNLKETVTKPFKDAYQSVKSFFGISSPSKKFAEMGEDIVQGMDNGMEDLPKNMKKKAEQGAAGMQSVVPTAAKAAGSAAVDTASASENSKVAVMIIQMMTNLIQGLVDAMGGKKVDSKGIDQTTADAISKAIPQINELLKGVGAQIKPLMDNINAAIQGVQVDESTGAKMETAVKMFSFVKDLINSFKNPFEGMVKWDANAADITNMLTSIGQVNAFLSWVVHDNLVGDMAEYVTSIANSMSGVSIDSIKKIDEFFKAVSGLITLFKDPFQGVSMEGYTQSAAILKNIGEIDLVLNNLVWGNSMASSGLGTVSSIAKHINAIADSVTPEIVAKLGGMQLFVKSVIDSAKLIEDLSGKGVVPAVKAAEDMIAAAIRLDEALTKGTKLNIDTKLRAFATKFGKSIGTMGKYVVQAKDVNIHVNFRIAIDATELEKVMVTNGSSVIKQRINLLLEAVKGDGKSTVIKTDAERAKLTSGGSPSDMSNYSY